MRTKPTFKRLSLLIGTLALTAFSLPAIAAAEMQCLHEHPADRPSIGLVLGGGGARGFAHVGVLELLEEMRVPYDYIAGTSMGSIVGGLAATGMDSGEISAVIRGADWADLFSDSTQRQDQTLRRKQDQELGLYGPKIGIGKDSTLLPAGVVAGQKILFLFETVTSQRAQASRFDQLPLPFRAVATDIVTGDMVVLDHGSLSNAMRASMAVPGAFDPVRDGNRLLADGGLVRNLPVDVVRAMGADVVIAVDVGTPLMDIEQIRNILSMIQQMTSLQIVKNTAEQVATLTGRDVLIRPDLGSEITSASFNSFEVAAPLGHDVDEPTREALARLSVSEAEYRAWRAGIQRCVTGPPTIQFVRLNNHSRFSDQVIESLITVQPGGKLDTEQLDADIRRIYGLGFIRLARYQVVEEAGQSGIEIEVEQDKRGTDFIETGLSLAGNGRGTEVNLQGGYLKTDLDDRGSEFRAEAQVGNDFGLMADLYKYLDDEQHWVINPQITYSLRDVLLFTTTGLALARADVNELTGGVKLGREFGRSAVLYGGVYRYAGTVKQTLGLPFPNRHYNGGEFRLGLIFDRLDDLYLPTRGARIDVQYIDSSETLGADDDFEQVRTHGLVSKTWGAHNALFTWRYNTTLHGATAPVYALFTGGGFLNMSGFEPAELNASNFGFVGAGYRYQVAKTGLWPGYAGMTIEYGNAADDRHDVFANGILNGSLYFAYDTPLGPLYLGYGWSEDRSGLLFLRLGAIFAGDNIGRR